MRYLLLLLVLVASCDPKKEPEFPKGTPVFSVQGTIGTDAISFAAGDADYAMETGFGLDPFQMYVFNGQLVSNCTGCGSLSISIRNYKPGFPVHPDSIDLQDFYVFYNKAVPYDNYYQTSFFVYPTPPEIGWSFGNNRYSASFTPTIREYTPGVFPVTCTGVFSATCFSELQQSVYINPNRLNKVSYFKVNHVNNRTVLLNTIPVDQNATVTWDFGDGRSGKGSIVTHEYANKGQYRVCMEYRTATDTFNLCQNVNTLDETKCLVNYNYITEFIRDSNQVSKVVIEWRSPDGRKFSSENTPQPSQSRFHILDRSAYEINAAGNRTRKFVFSADCIVSDGNTSLPLKIERGVFAYAIPNP